MRLVFFPSHFRLSFHFLLVCLALSDEFVLGRPVLVLTPPRVAVFACLGLLLAGLMVIFLLVLAAFLRFCP